MHCLCEKDTAPTSAYQAWVARHESGWLAPYVTDAIIIFGSASVVTSVPLIYFLIRICCKDRGTVEESLRTRVSAVTASFGWALIVFGVMPIMFIVVGIRADPVIGNPIAFFITWPFGVLITMLGVSRKDTSKISCLVTMWVCLYGAFVFVFVALLLWNASAGVWGLIAKVSCALMLIVSLAMAVFVGTLLCGKGRSMKPEAKLLRVWKAFRVFMTGLIFFLLLYTTIPSTITWYGSSSVIAWITNILVLLCAVGPTPQVRARVCAFVARMTAGKSNDKKGIDEAIGLIWLSDLDAVVPDASTEMRVTASSAAA